MIKLDMARYTFGLGPMLNQIWSDLISSEPDKIISVTDQIIFELEPVFSRVHSLFVCFIQ